MKLLSIEEAPSGSTKKYVATFDMDNGKIKRTSFGARGYDDYTTHKDKARRDRYRNRHSKDLNTGDPTKAGYLSYYILWGDSTSLNSSIKSYKRMFNL